MRLTYQQIEKIYNNMSDDEMVNIESKDHTDLGNIVFTIYDSDVSEVVTKYIDMYGSPITKENYEE